MYGFKREDILFIGCLSQAMRSWMHIPNAYDIFFNLNSHSINKV